MDTGITILKIRDGYNRQGKASHRYQLQLKRRRAQIDRLYHYGRHHPCLVLLPDDNILMTYVVRLGYPRDAEGFP